MKKIAFNFILGLFLIIISLVFILSTFGIETNKFNNVISEKASQTNNINLKLNSIKFKLDYKELRLFLETKNPEIIYRDILVPAQHIKVYIDFIPLLKTNLNVRKINLILKELDMVQLNKLSALIKPSNFKSLINNKIKKGTIKSEIEIFLTEKGSLKNFIAKGTVKGLEADVFSNLNLTKVNSA